jgi:hypothetical protein
MVLLFAMFHFMIGYRLVYSLGILYAKEQAKELIVEKSTNIKELKLTLSDYNSLKWTEKNKEFCFNNEMYDVAGIEKSGEGYIIKVFCDNMETGWAISLCNYEKELFHPDQSTKGAKSAEDIMLSFQKDYIPPSEFKTPVFSYTLGVYPVLSIQKPSLLISKIIWHPPYNC